MTRIMNSLKSIGNKKSARVLALISAGVIGMLTLPAAAPAGERHDWRDGDHHDNHSDVRVDINLGRPDTHYETRTTRVWVEPVFQNVCERVWVAPVTSDECTQVWVPDQFEIRDVQHRDGHHKWTTREQVLVERGHYVDQHRAVVVSDGHWEDRTTQQVVAPGHWEYRTEQVRVEDHGQSFVDFFARFGR